MRSVMTSRGGFLARHWLTAGREVGKLGWMAGIDGPGDSQSATSGDNGLSQWDRCSPAG